MTSDIEELAGRLEEIRNNDDRAVARELVAAILRLYGDGLQRMMALAGDQAVRRFAEDRVLVGLLVLHGLHPDDIEKRVRHAVRLRQRNVEVVTASEELVRVRLRGKGEDRDAVEAVLREAAPDAARIEVEFSVAGNDFVPLSAVGKGSHGE